MALAVKILIFFFYINHDYILLCIMPEFIGSKDLKTSDKPRPLKRPLAEVATFNSIG
jgi:hypothetical protein